jgi:beta-phosphoglucomutase family hydrolase
MLGIPDHIQAALFDLDGVLTRTAAVHAAAWREMFDDFLENWARLRGEPFVPFDVEHDYARYVDGRPRLDGVRSFLAARHIRLPEGAGNDPPFPARPFAPPGDPWAGMTVHALANRKNILLQQKIERDGVEAYPGSVRYLRMLAAAGIPRAVVSSSANADDVVRAAGIADLLPVRVNGKDAERRHLRGKPAPDTFLAGAAALGVDPAHAAVFEDALAGVEAGRAGHFGHVVGVDRVGQADELRRHGADVVVSDLAELLDAA